MTQHAWDLNDGYCMTHRAWCSMMAPSPAGDFWAIIDQQLEAATKAGSAADVLRIFASPGHNSPGFFGGSGGDDNLDAALEAAGWSYVWARASYHWAMRAPDGSGITYVEGDIFGDVQRPLP